MTERKLLESDGATWRFRHRLLQDYFIEKYEVKEDDYLGYKTKGYFYYNNKKRDKAIEYFEKAVTIKSNDAYILTNLGFLLICLGKTEKAEQHLLIAIELGSHALGNMNLGHIYLCKGAKNKALDCYKKGLDSFKSKKDFWYGMQDDFQYLTQYGMTETYYQSVLEELRKM